jgi:hypothetical protein
MPPGIFKGPRQTNAIVCGTAGWNNPLQYRLYEKTRSGGMRRQPIGVAVLEAGETKLKFGEEVRPAALGGRMKCLRFNRLRREIDHRLCLVCVWR